MDSQLHLTSAKATAYSQHFRSFRCNGSTWGGFLEQDFWEYFEDWTVEDFRKVAWKERILLRDDLQALGVFVQRGRHIEVARALFEAVHA